MRNDGLVLLKATRPFFRNIVSEMPIEIVEQTYPKADFNSFIFSSSSKIPSDDPKHEEAVDALCKALLGLC